MRKVALFSVLLVAGLVLSQALPGAFGAAWGPIHEAVRLGTVVCLAFIMVHVGYEFEIDRSRLRSYGVDYGIAFTAAAFPWVFCAAYFVFVMRPPEAWGTWDAWRESLLTARFASPTSAGVLFSMLAAGGLAATWLFRKARILAIFDDLDTVLLMIPLKMMIVGLHWQMGAIVVGMFAMLWAAWRWLHAVRIPTSWPWVLGYAAGLTAVTEALHAGSLVLDPEVPIHIEILLPAFVLGCVMARPAGTDPHVDDAREGHQEGPESRGEQAVATAVSAVFMVLVGLSMPRLDLGAIDWGTTVLHVLAITLVGNLGKMYPAFCYRREVPFRERLALAIGMFPRGEVGAGVLVVSLTLLPPGGPAQGAIQVALLALALNLVLTGAFIVVVKRLLGPTPTPASRAA